MKHFIENLALILVGLLALAIVVLIVQYNLIQEDETVASLGFEVPKVDQQTQRKNYLDALEGYGDDTDVEVDATQEGEINSVSIRSEMPKDILDDTIEDPSKEFYMQNLEGYNETPKSDEMQEIKEEKKKIIKPPLTPLKPNPSGEPEKLPSNKIVDEIGMAIDALDL
jgi:hypothetical protein